MKSFPVVSLERGSLLRPPDVPETLWTSLLELFADLLEGSRLLFVDDIKLTERTKYWTDNGVKPKEVARLTRYLNRTRIVLPSGANRPAGIVRLRPRSMSPPAAGTESLPFDRYPSMLAEATSGTPVNFVETDASLDEIRAATRVALSLFAAPFRHFDYFDTYIGRQTRNTNFLEFFDRFLMALRDRHRKMTTLSLSIYTSLGVPDRTLPLKANGSSGRLRKQDLLAALQEKGDAIRELAAKTNMMIDFRCTEDVKHLHPRVLIARHNKGRASAAGCRIEGGIAALAADSTWIAAYVDPIPWTEAKRLRDVITANSQDAIWSTRAP